VEFVTVLGIVSHLPGSSTPTGLIYTFDEVIKGEGTIGKRWCVQTTLDLHRTLSASRSLLTGCTGHRVKLAREGSDCAVPCASAGVEAGVVGAGEAGLAMCCEVPNCVYLLARRGTGT
jgi:hypothetical protein